MPKKAMWQCVCNCRNVVGKKCRRCGKAQNQQTPEPTSPWVKLFEKVLIK